MPNKMRMMAAGHGDKVLAEWEPLVETEVSTARMAFSEHMRAGRMAFDVRGNGDNVAIQEFDPAIEDILIVPMIQGG